MARRLPPLNALRAFEAAARHLSFTLAAQELHVTQAAISHQVKALEDSLGVALFKRRNRGLSLTDAGAGYLPALREAFDIMAAATERLARDDVRGPLKVSVLPSFGAKWLLPRLARFRDGHPEIDVLVSATSHAVDFAREDMDLAVRYGWGRYPGLHVDFLMDEEIYPICSPRLTERGPPLERPEDLQHHTLLHDYAPGTPDLQSWTLWLQTAGLKSAEWWQRGPAYSDSAMLVQAAVEGQGIALGRESLCADDIAAQRLIRLFPKVRFDNKAAYYIVAPPANAERPKIKLFREWLLEEARAHVAQARKGAAP